MRIIGPDELVFGVDDLAACRQFLSDYGLTETDWSEAGGTFVALDNTAITVRSRRDPTLPAELASQGTLRLTVYGVEDRETLDQIAAEMARDRAVTRGAEGSVSFEDAVGFRLTFQLTRRIALDLPPEQVNSPGAAPARGVNRIGAWQEAPAKPRTLSHIVYFTPDMPAMEAFYVERLRFVVTDRFNDVGPFLRPQACVDHHTLFMLHTPASMQGLEHLAFHMQGPTELMLAGSRLVQQGYESFWGPGRHRLGSNWFWYFNSPLLTHFEYDADMDLHDDDWVPRAVDIGPESAQLFLFENVAKWSPGGGPAGDVAGGVAAGDGEH